VFESEGRLTDDVNGLLTALRESGDGRYACIADRTGILFQSADAHEEPAGWTVRTFLEPLLPAVFRIPESLAGDGPAEDVFEAWDDDDFLLAFLNNRVALILACPDAEAARTAIEPVFTPLADRLLRLKPAWRVDDAGRGLFFGRPRVDWIVAAREER
jgi:hypothetical protein